MGWMALVDTTTGEEIGIVGDEPWDIMGVALDVCTEFINNAIDDINKVYQEQFGRDATEIEIESVIQFTEAGIMTALRKRPKDV